jgi:H+/Cl- antiporter ClcA
MAGAEPGGQAVDPREYLRLVALAAAIGIPAAFVAALFLQVVDQVQKWLFTDLPKHLGHSSPPWYLIVGLPVVGALLVIIARKFLPGDGGHAPLGGLSLAPTPLSSGFGVALAAIGTLGFGLVLGPEGPLIALGSVVGMGVTPFVRLGDKEKMVMATAGSFSAVSALFGGPLVAGMLLVEAGLPLGPTLIPALLPGVVAAAVGYVIFLGVGSWSGMKANTLNLSGLPPYHGTHVGDLFMAIVVGVAAVLIITVVHWIGHRIDDLTPRRMPMPWLLVLGGLAVGLIAQLSSAFGADPQDVLFSGQRGIPVLVAENSLKIVIVLLVAKGIAYMVSLGSGFRGGPIFPAIFLGVALTSIIEIVFGVSPTLAVSVGAAAGMGAQTRLLFAPILFAMLLVGTNGTATVSAAVLASAAAWLAGTAIDRRTAAKAAPAA